MLNITVQTSAAGAKQYFARSDYYTKDSQELVGRWGGKGATLLGLSGEVQKVEFERLCDNLHPITGEPLTRITRDNRRVGYDFTWSAPKSVSLAHALTGDQRIVDAFRQSIHETLGEMEGEMETRVRKKDADHNRTTGNWVWSEFVHFVSRPVEQLAYPQLHSHIFIANASFDLVEEKWKAGNFGKIKGDAYYWQAVQQTRFANRLQELGYRVRRTKDAFEIVGVPESAIKKFSMRTAVIEKVAKELGITDPKIKAKLGATTREAKATEIPYSDLKTRWNKLLTPEERLALLQIERNSSVMAGNDATHVQYAVEHLFQRASVVDERRLMATALKHGIGEVTPEGVRHSIQKLGLLRGERDGKTEVTTREVLREERAVIGYAVKTKETCRPLLREGEGIIFVDQQLDAEQRAAVELPLRSSDRIMIIKGLAGTGKSRSMVEAITQLKSHGREVTFVTPKATLVENFRREGLEAHTLASLLENPSMQLDVRDGVIVLDEASMVDTPTMIKLFDIARDTNARIVLLGDIGQLSAVDRGSPLRLLQEHAGLKVVEISTIRRQETQEYRDIAKQLARGQTGEALEKLDKLGRIKLTPVWDTYEPIAKEYAEKVAAAIKEGRDPETEVLIVAPTHSEGNKVADAVRKELRDRNLLGKDEWVVEGLRPVKVTISGRNLRQLYDYLHQHRMPWVAEAPGDFASDGETIISKTEFVCDRALSLYEESN